MILADSEDDGLADLAADGVAQGIFEKGFAKKLIGALREETLFKLALLEGLLLIFPICVFELRVETLVL